MHTVKMRVAIGRALFYGLGAGRNSDFKTNAGYAFWLFCAPGAHDASSAFSIKICDVFHLSAAYIQREKCPRSA